MPALGSDVPIRAREGEGDGSMMGRHDPTKAQQRTPGTTTQWRDAATEHDAQAPHTPRTSGDIAHLETGVLGPHIPPNNRDPRSPHQPSMPQQPAPAPAAWSSSVSSQGVPPSGPGMTRPPAVPAFQRQETRAVEDDEEELQRFVTTRMAALTRDPGYARVQRRLAARRRKRGALGEVMMLIDIGISLLALLIVSQYQEPLYQFLPTWVPTHLLRPGDVALGLIVLVLASWPVILSVCGLYRGDWAHNLFAPGRAMRAVFVAGLITCGLLYMFQVVQPRTFLLSFVVADALLLAVSRVVLRPIFVRLVPRRRILVIGTSRLAIDAARTVVSRHNQGLELVGVAGPEGEYEREPDAADDWQEALYQSWVTWRLGGIRDVPELVRRHEVDLVLIALAPNERQIGSWVISSLAHLPCQVYVVPDVVAETAKTVVDVIDGAPIIGVTESAISGWNARLKRMLDLVITVPLVLLLSPVMLAITVWIRLDSPGPALFKQERVGQHNRRFRMYKFRSMYVDADKRARAFAVRTSEGLVHKRRDDPRITHVGGFLRRTSLDELPQLLNVLKGDMSLVGPRPELPWIVERYRAWQYRRLLVPQGITGWWQVHGRSDRVLHLHTQDDIYYVRNYSLWLDIRILLMTVKVVLTGKGAF